MTFQRVAFGIREFYGPETDRTIYKGYNPEKKIVIEENRELALRKALAEIQSGDILMVLGKGHEEYQIIKDIKDDKCIILDPNGLKSFIALNDSSIISVFLSSDEQQSLIQKYKEKRIFNKT